MTIKTSKIEIHNHPKFRKETDGIYALITITDSGIGMNQETIQHIFEPFFTTKKLGKGTGLGLSTVFGIISQSGGNIYVGSELGTGTEFDILFPINDSKIHEDTKKKIDSTVFYGNETILLIEDNLDVRKYIENSLSYYNYNVLTALDYTEAISIYSQHQDKIKMVISDIMLPGKSGKEIVSQFLISNPKLKYIYISGYSANILGANLTLDKNINFIQKPFTRDTLMLKIRSIFNG